MKKLLFVYNPNAGKGLLKPNVSDIVDVFVKSGYEVTIYPTQAYKDAYKKVKHFKMEYDLLVCSGGDGTIDEVVTGMIKRENRIPIGYIPAGTTNDFACSLHIPRDMMQAADNAVNGSPLKCDVGRFNEDVFVYIAAFGIFTDVSYETKQEMKNLLGHLAYVLEGAKRIFNVPSYKVKVTHDGEVIEDEFIYGMVTNSKSVGGFRNMIGKEVVFDDGLFEVTLIKTPKNPIQLHDILLSLSSTQVDTSMMYTFKAHEIELESVMEIPWTLDGEFGGDHDYVKIQNEKQGMQIMVPLEKKSTLMEHPQEAIAELKEKEIQETEE